MTLITPGSPLMRPQRPIDPLVLRSLDGTEVLVPQAAVTYIEPNLAASLVGSMIQGVVAALLPQMLALRRQRTLGGSGGDGDAGALADGALGIEEHPLAARLAVHAASLRTAAAMEQEPGKPALITLTAENCAGLADLIEEAVDALNDAPAQA